ncbi:MAG: hypothetical protein JJT76_07075 [Clostridiaceae bacterium]|nr:hypothetical protein [Clostridiaceae bacterium]
MKTSKANKVNNIIVNIIIFATLLILPIFTYVYHVRIYYVVIISFFIPVIAYRIIYSEKIEEKFYIKWSEARKKAKIFIILKEGLCNFFRAVIIILIARFIVDSHTPSYNLFRLSLAQYVSITLIVLLTSSVVGTIIWYDKEKRYANIYLDREGDNKI